MSCRWVLCAALAMNALPVLADPFSIVHTGTVSTSAIPGINAGQTYTIRLVFDNGGASSVGQAWNGAHLRCAIWTFNTAANVVFTQNLVSDPPSAAVGSATTNGAGVLATNFSNVSNTGVTAANYTVSGTALVAPVNHFANSMNGILYDTGFAREVRDISGGVQMAAAGWGNPLPFAGNCAGLILAAALVNPQSIPSLSQWAVIALSSLLAMAGVAGLRRRSGLKI